VRKVDHVAVLEGGSMIPVQLATELGDARIEVYEDLAPASTGYFLADVRSGLYDGSSFFRIVTLTNQRLVERARKIAVIQGGLKHTRDDLPPVIPHETTAMTGLRHLRGTVSLARFAPGAVYHSFFICMRDEPALDFVALDDALKALAKFDERKSRVIELRFFGGLRVEETASVLKVSPATVMGDWRLAKAWLQREMRADE